MHLILFKNLIYFLKINIIYYKKIKPKTPMTIRYGENRYNLLLLRTFIRKCKDIIPEKKATIQEIIKVLVSIPSISKFLKSLNSKKVAPKIAGIEIIKEISPIYFLSMPNKLAIAKVEPAREIPGNTANP